jgi:hypothetical protein
MADPHPKPAPAKGVAPADASLAAGAMKKPLPSAAERALAEAAERRAARDRATAEPLAKEAGRKGLDPARYGDWEVKGIASDF